MAGLAAAVGWVQPGVSAGAVPTAPIEVQILGLNDFHGQLEPVPATSSGGRIGATPAGGVEFLATHVRQLRATNDNTVFVSAGDLIGATPLISALFHDEPTIEAFNLMELDFNGVGNHEFDEGIDELLRMQNGGCHPVDGCQDGDPFNGADFEFLAANVKHKSNGQTIFPPYAIRQFAGVPVAFIGMTLEGTPSIVTPTAVSSVDFFDEADTVNALVPVLKAQGVETFVVLLHEGGSVSAPGNGAGAGGETNMNLCLNPTGALPPIVERMDDEIDVVVTGHTNWAINCVIDGKIVTGAAATGRLVTDIDLTLSRTTRDVSSATVNNRIVTQGVEKAADLTVLVEKYRALSAPLANRSIGSTTAAITRAGNAAGESALGDVIADAQLEATAPAVLGGAVAAFMNAGGIRADLPAGPITYGQAFSVQPFGNSLVTKTMTGDMIDALLEQQFQGGIGILQISHSLTYDRSLSAAVGSRISNIRINGIPVDPGTNYRVTMNNFLAEGGDNYTVFRLGTNPLGGAVDLDALVDYFGAHSPIAPGPQNRITLVP